MSKKQEKLNSRRKKVLAGVVREHIKTAQPISSDYLLAHYDLHVSPATIRNDMLYLEKEGFLEQPHMSSGRIPSDTGYRFYINELTDQPLLGRTIERILDDMAHHSRHIIHDITLLQTMADYLAQVSGNVGMVSLAENDVVFKNGLKNLMHQPEFQNIEQIKNFASTWDELDKSLEGVWDHDGGVQVWIGKENKLTLPGFGLVCARVSMGKKRHQKILAGILGPKRMDYERNIALLNKLKKLFEE